MPKSCTLCTSSQTIQDKVLSLSKDNVSLKKIEVLLGQEDNFKISASSIGRHLHSCLSAQKNPGSHPISSLDITPLERLVQNPTDGDTVHEALRIALAQGVLQCHDQIVERGDLESFRALEVLVNVQDKLYPQSQLIQESPASLREEAYRTILEHGKVPSIPQD